MFLKYLNALWEFLLQCYLCRAKSDKILIKNAEQRNAQSQTVQPVIVLQETQLDKNYFIVAALFEVQFFCVLHSIHFYNRTT